MIGSYKRLTNEQRSVLEQRGYMIVYKKQRHRLSRRGKDILISWAIIAVLCFVLGFLMGAIVIEIDGTNAARTMPKANRPERPLASLEAAQEPETAAVEQEPTQEEQVVAEKPQDAGIAIEPVVVAQKYVSLGEFKLTSYCACEKCCGYWATIRPLDTNGEPIVYTASGAIACQGVTVAADTDILPFGTVILIGGDEFIVQDVGGGVNGKHIDIYFEDHQAALGFGVRYETIYRKGDV